MCISITFIVQVENDLDRIRNASSHQELMDSFKEFGKSVVELSERAAQRQAVCSHDTCVVVFLIHLYIHHQIPYFMAWCCMDIGP